jgi:hypothetical protein
LKGEEEKDPY